jgi:acetyl-CoA synthetase
MGRVDDVLNVAGHRLSTMEVESALVAHDKVAEGSRTARTTSRVRRFQRSCRSSTGSPQPGTKRRTGKWVAKEIGSLAKPDDIRFTDMFPNA